MQNLMSILTKNTKMDEEEQIIDSFSTPDNISDVTIIVEDKKIFAHKAILGKNKIFIY